MYATIKKGCTGDDVKLLCKLLNTTERDFFDATLEGIVKKYQNLKNLGADGIVGFNTWSALLGDKKDLDSGKVTEEDYKNFAALLGCEVAALKAVVSVETGGKCGFIFNKETGEKHCQLLFEAHLFYSNLKSAGINADQEMKKYPNLISKTWNKSLYKGGWGEVERLKTAMTINKTAALKSASYGLFQVIGGNYKVCGYKNPEEMYEKNNESEYQQLLTGIKFIKGNGLDKYLKNKDWAGFAYRYNGSGYKQNKYDEKLKNSYNKYKS